MFILKRLVSCFLLVTLFFGSEQAKVNERSNVTVFNVTIEEEIIKNLTSDPNKYNKDTRPADSVNVTFLLSLIQIDEFDEKREHLITQIQISETWFDKRLSWDPLAFSGVGQIKIKADKIWTPDLFVYNSADNKNSFISIDSKTYVTVNSSGGVYIEIPSQSINTICLLDLTMFPFDKQTCSLKFSSWSFSYDEINFIERESNVEYYQPDNIWKFKSLKSGEYEKSKENAFEYILKFWRKSEYFILNGVVPLVLGDFLIISAFYEHPVKLTTGINSYI